MKFTNDLREKIPARGSKSIEGSIVAISMDHKGLALGADMEQ
jgi:hypothetical protein